jgi:hypothetical protein
MLVVIEKIIFHYFNKYFFQSSAQKGLESHLKRNCLAAFFTEQRNE